VSPIRAQIVTTASSIENKAEATRTLTSLGTTPRFTAPGDPGFPAASMFPAMSPADAERLRAYLKQLREEAVARLVDRLYNEDGTPNKFWMAFSKKKFMGLTLRS